MRIIYYNRIYDLLMTCRCAVLLTLPVIKHTVPLMASDVCLRVSLWMVPIFSTTTVGPGCSVSPFRVQVGALATGEETSHSKQASAGAVTFPSCSSLTIRTDWAVSTEEVPIHRHVTFSYLYTANAMFLNYYLLKEKEAFAIWSYFKINISQSNLENSY